MNINRENYEEILFDYMEGNLSAEQHAEVTKQIESDPFLKKELEAFKQTVLTPSNDVVFPDIEKLLKKENKRKIIPLYSYVSVGVAAAIALFVIVYMPDYKGTSTESIASNNKVEQPKTTEQPDSEDQTPDKVDKQLNDSELLASNSTTTNEGGATAKTPKNKVTKQVNTKPDTRAKITVNKMEPKEVKMFANDLGTTNRPDNRIDIIEFNGGTNSAFNYPVSPDSNEDELDRFDIKSTIYNGVTNLVSSVRLPRLTLFSKDDNGNRKFKMVVHFQTYSTTIKIR